jgi:ABC-type transport system involved in cytochrome bd biosynthesis fused ATPase/permease subunit
MKYTSITGGTRSNINVFIHIVIGTIVHIISNQIAVALMSVSGYFNSKTHGSRDG